ncbi:protein kinase interacting protein [Pseudoplusia includens SNPV IE]|uniref:PKIP n=2 Tax=Chrysodeixis includens nucleopolyhedrovirus TaxID=1207438 RepID=A0A1C8ZZ84_9ABAC|nr:protein kinase interacting protein [Pseudoplusia includens SNPV IE]AOL56574.1 PKIP [Chrysodeixis includens nucleopolyhedrovirus]AJD80827.1 protein kinase interacting protein [Pseudoplusia includens SNPV IE]AOL56715.1 PKIP [Chrysodeixis includens nucleopolyhedrovirus]AOL56857.1 PKIP [Chrysodeixis includens nucleopolyhedrovirus]AOL56999.1 PKIP [Chrysodeixis includens nucleopolyhedrovirus]
MDQNIKRLFIKETNLKEKHESLDRAYRKRPKEYRNENAVDEMAICAAYLYGVEEQLFSLLSNMTQERRIDFINDLTELDFSNYEIELLLNSKSDDYLLQKYHIHKKSEHIQKIFKNNSIRFVKVLEQFVIKRQAYKKKPKDNLLEELVVLKSIIIKHLCVMEKLTQK